MKKHQVLVVNFIDKYVVHELAGVVGGGKRRSLVVRVCLFDLSAKYQVLDHDSVIYEGESLGEAIAFYNEWEAP
jgi:hypothetical protein